MRPENSLRLGSITKPFTAAAILLLADEGKLALTDSISRYLPGYLAEAGEAMTIEQLLTHTSGVPEYSAKPDLKPASKRNLSVSQVIDAFKNDSPRFEPGTRFAYSNSGYFLLGAIVEKVSGMSYASFLRQRIFLPLNMRSTGYEGEEGGDILPATGYTLRDREFVRAPEISMSLAYSAGALVSTVDDLARFDAAISAGSLLKPATWQ
jgi:CubicO group peptidase (beta-lactamase class C family)